jgi:hypothetical protein
VDIELWMKFEKERRIGRIVECKLHNGIWKGKYEELLQGP